MIKLTKVHRIEVSDHLNDTFFDLKYIGNLKPYNNYL